MEDKKRPSLVYPRLCRIHRFAVLLALIYSSYQAPAYGQKTVSLADRTALQSVFRGELGKYDQETISKYLRYTDLSYGHEWCAAFVSWCFGQIERTQPRTPWSPALFPNKKKIWQQAQKNTDPKIQIGMVWGIHIQSKGRIGHVGFVDAEHKGIITTVEGNTKPPDGKKNNGVYRKRRPIRTLKAIAEWLESEN